MKSSVLKFSTSALAAALVATPAFGQLFEDAEGDALKWDTGVTAGLTDIRFGFDYGSFDIFGDGFLTGSIGEAPNSAGGTTATTGIFISVNNDSIAQGGTGAAAAAAVFASGLDVGAGTADPHFRVKFDAFHSTATGWDYGGGDVQVNGTTNYILSGALYETNAIEVQALNAGTNPGGIALATTGEAGSGSDWYTVIDGQTYSRDGATPDPTGTQYLGLHSGLATSHIYEAFVDDGFTVADIVRDNTDNSSALHPIPGDEASFDDSDPATFQQYFFENFPNHNDPIHYTADPVLQPGSPLANDTVSNGQSYNRWAEHEISVVDGVYYHSINGIPVVQLEINDDPLDPDRTIFDEIDEAGTIMLGFWDRFSSISDDPEGANFAVFDNVVVESLNSGDAPFDINAYLIAEGYIPGASGPIEGDYNGDGFVSQGDLDLVLLNWGDAVAPGGFDETAIPGGGPFDGLMSQNELDGVLLNWGDGTPPSLAVPEPTSLALLGLGGLAMLRRRA